VYVLYSVLIVTFFLVMSPYLAWQALRYHKYVGSLRQRSPALLGSNGGDHVKSVEDKAGEAAAGRLPEQGR